MGEIWLAEDPLIGRSVAVKRILGRRPDQVHRFEVEAQVTGQLEHPGIVPIHELGVGDDGLPFYVMKFVNGRTLQSVIEEYHEADPAKEPCARSSSSACCRFSCRCARRWRTPTAGASCTGT